MRLILLSSPVVLLFLASQWAMPAPHHRVKKLENVEQHHTKIRHQRHLDEKLERMRTKHGFKYERYFRRYHNRKKLFHDTSVVINELNAYTGGEKTSGKFIELKHAEPCIFERSSGSLHGPPLQGYYVVNLRGVNNETDGNPVIDFVANLSSYHFKRNSSLFVIGNKQSKPDLLFSSGDVVFPQKINRRMNQSDNNIENNDKYPAAIILLKVIQ